MFGWTVIDSIKKHALSEYPRESCGLVAGHRYHRCENVHEDPENHFRISAQQFGRVCIEHGDIQAVVHSHPDGPDYPTVADQREQILTGFTWGVTVVSKGEVALDPWWWGDSVPIAPIDCRRFRHGIHDCFGLVRDWIRLNLGVVVPNVVRGYEFWRQGSNTLIENYKSAGFVIIDELEKPGDCAIFKIRSQVPNHCAVYIGDDTFLHHFPDRLPQTGIVGRWLKYIAKDGKRDGYMRFVGNVA